MKIFLINLFLILSLSFINAQQYCCNIPKIGEYSSTLWPAYDFIRINDKVLFQTLIERELEIHDVNTDIDTIFDINPGLSQSRPANFEKLNGNIFFTINRPDNKSLILKLSINDLTISDYVNDATVYDYYYLRSISNSKLCYFKTQENLYTSFWTIDDPNLAPIMIKDSVFRLTESIGDRNYLGKKVYYSDSTIFITDGIKANSTIIRIPNTSTGQYSITNLYPDYQNNFIFSAYSINSGDALYTYDIKTKTAKIIYNLSPDVNLNSGDLIGMAMGKALFSSQKRQILSYNPLDQTIDTLLPYLYHGFILGNINGFLYFASSDSLYRTDGTKTGTSLVKKFKKILSNYSFEYYPIKFDNKIYFRGDDGVTGSELWSIGPLIDDVKLVKDFDTGSASGLHYIFGRDSVLYFLADSAGIKKRFYILDPPYETLQAQIVIDHVPECNKTNTGILHVEIKGSQGPFKYHWNFNDSPEDYLAFLDSGLYAVTITDGSGKTVTAQVLLKEIPSFSTNVVIKNSDVNQNNGQINLTINGSSGPYIYSWSNNLPPNPNQNNLAPGIYSCTITDSNGCKDIQIIEVKLKTSTNNLLPEGIKIYPTITQDNIKIENNSGESITIELRDINGKLISKDEVSKLIEVSIQNQPSSLFIAMVYNNKMQFLGSQKIIKIN